MIRLFLAKYQAPLLAILLATTAIVCFGLGYRQKGLEDAKEQAKQLTRLVNARNKQDAEAAKRDQANEAAAATLRTRTDEKTRHAYEAAPRYARPVPRELLHAINDAARAPAASESDATVPGTASNR